MLRNAPHPVGSPEQAHKLASSKVLRMPPPNLCKQLVVPLAVIDDAHKARPCLSCQDRVPESQNLPTTEKLQLSSSFSHHDS